MSGSGRAQAVFRDPLVHFLAAGLLLFGLYQVLEPGSLGTERVVTVSWSDQENLAGSFERSWGRRPDSDEMQGLVEAHIREEILYREAIELGLDQDDPVVRGRLAQRLMFDIDNVAAFREPDEAALEKFLSENADRYRLPARISFEQVRATTESEAAAILADLRAGTDPDNLGTPDDLPRAMQTAPPERIAALFGNDFAVALERMSAGDWKGPVPSAYGHHAVRVLERTEPSLPKVDEIRARLTEDWRETERRVLREAYYDDLRRAYAVTVESRPDGPGAP